MPDAQKASHLSQRLQRTCVEVLCVQHEHLVHLSCLPQRLLLPAQPLQRGPVHTVSLSMVSCLQLGVCCRLVLPGAFCTRDFLCCLWKHLLPPNQASVDLLGLQRLSTRGLVSHKVLPRSARRPCPGLPALPAVRPAAVTPCPPGRSPEALSLQVPQQSSATDASDVWCGT